MTDLRLTKTALGPFSATGGRFPLASIPDGNLPSRRYRIPLLSSGFGWLRNCMALFGAVSLMGFLPQEMRPHEQFGRVMGEVAAAQTVAQTTSQAELQGAVAKAQAEAQQFALAYATQAIEAYKALLQMRVASVAASLDATKSLVVDRAKADLDARNDLLRINAQLEADTVKRITEVKVSLEQGKVSAVNATDMIVAIVEGFGGDATRLRDQSATTKGEVLGGVTSLSGRTPQFDTGITDPITNGQLSSIEVTRSLARAQGEIQRIMDVRYALPPMIYPGAIVPTTVSVKP